MIDDAELLRRYAEERSEAAFAELVQRHIDLVHSAALRRLAGDSHAAADVTQRVFTALARRAAALARNAVLLGWLYSTTRNIAVDHVRAERRRRDRERKAQIMNESGDDPSCAAEWLRLQPILDEAMDELGERDRNAVLLRFFARRSFGEIGRALGLSEDAARMRVDRALAKLRTQLSRQGVGSTAAGLAIALTNQAVCAAPVELATAVTASSLTFTAPGMASVVPLLQFMSTSKLAGSAVVLVAALCIGTAIRELRAVQEAKSDLLTARESYQATQARVTDLEKRAVAEEKTTLSLQQSLEAARARSPAVASRSSNGQARLGAEFVTRHPAVQRALAERTRTHVAGWYQPLFKTLRLSPDDMARCIDLIVQNTPVRFSVPEVGELSLEPEMGNVEFENRMSELLGEKGFEQYRNSSRIRTYWRMATTIAAASYYSASPLTAGHAERMMQILAEHSRFPDDSHELSFDWDAVLPKLTPFLSSEQLTPLRYLQASTALSVEIKRRMRERNAAASQSGGKK